jgi:hypothetical protein
VEVVERTAVCGRMILGMQLPHALDASKIDVGYRVRVDGVAE